LLQSLVAVGFRKSRNTVCSENLVAAAIEPWKKYWLLSKVLMMVHCSLKAAYMI